MAIFPSTVIASPSGSEWRSNLLHDVEIASSDYAFLAMTGRQQIRIFVLYSHLCPLSVPLTLAPTSIAAAPGGTRNKAWNRRIKLNSRLGPNSTSGMDVRFWHLASHAPLGSYCWWLRW